MDRQRVRELREELEQLLATYFDEDVDVVAKVGNARYTATSVEFKIDLSEKSPDGTVQSQEVASFRRLAAAYGLAPDDLGREFETWDGKRYKVAGLNPRRTKNPVVVERLPDGKRFIMPASAVARGLAAKKVK